MMGKSGPIFEDSFWGHIW